jgi:predicted transcriptional regulator
MNFPTNKYVEWLKVFLEKADKNFDTNTEISENILFEFSQIPDSQLSDVRVHAAIFEKVSTWHFDLYKKSDEESGYTEIRIYNNKLLEKLIRTGWNKSGHQTMRKVVDHLKYCNDTKYTESFSVIFQQYIFDQINEAEHKLKIKIFFELLPSELAMTTENFTGENSEIVQSWAKGYKYWVKTKVPGRKLEGTMYSTTKEMFGDKVNMRLWDILRTLVTYNDARVAANVPMWNKYRTIQGFTESDNLDNLTKEIKKTAYIASHVFQLSSEDIKFYIEKCENRLSQFDEGSIEYQRCLAMIVLLKIMRHMQEIDSN